MNCGAETTCILAAIAITVVLYMHFVKGSAPLQTASKCASARQGAVETSSDEDCYEKEALQGYDYDDDDDCDAPKAEGNPSDCRYNSRVNTIKSTCKANRALMENMKQDPSLKSLSDSQRKRVVEIVGHALAEYL